MAIRHWTGRRLVGTWVAGIAGEVVLLALPIAFLAVVAVGDIARHAFSSKPVGEVRALTAPPVAERLAARDARIAAAAAEGRAIALAPPPSLPPAPPAALSRPVDGAMIAQGLQPAPWYAVPLAGAVALYVLAIPIGLLAITFVWMISRFSGYRPPPSA